MALSSPYAPTNAIDRGSRRTSPSCRSYYARLDTQYRTLKKLGRRCDRLLTRDEARRIAVNVAKLPDCSIHRSKRHGDQLRIMECCENKGPRNRPRPRLAGALSHRTYTRRPPTKTARFDLKSICPVQLRSSGLFVAKCSGGLKHLSAGAQNRAHHTRVYLVGALCNSAIKLAAPKGGAAFFFALRPVVHPSRGRGGSRRISQS